MLAKKFHFSIQLPTMAYRLVRLSGVVSRSQVRHIASSTPKLFITDFLNSRKSLQQKNEQIAETQDDEDVKKIVFLNEKSSDNYKVFDASTDLQGFAVEQWKKNSVLLLDIEKTYDADLIQQILQDSYKAVHGEIAAGTTLESVRLEDLELRFQVAKEVQLRLGFDVSDYVFSGAHTLNDLQDSLTKIASTRWKWERNPSALTLRKEDFKDHGNVYLNEELNEVQRKKFFNELVEKATTHQQ